MSKDLSYEDALRRAHSEGWRDPIEITNLEIKAYEAGMRTERNRVLSVFKPIMDKPIMRIMDMQKLLDKVRRPNNPV